MTKRVIEPAVLLVMLAIVGLRPLIGESFHTAETSVPGPLEDTADPWALTTILVDITILLLASIVTLTRALNREPAWRRSGLEWGICVLVVAVALSSAFAYSAATDG